MIRVQEEDFDVGAEIDGLAGDDHGVGAIVTFIGLVRDINSGDAVADMTLEHYPGMTERMLDRIEAEAMERWPLSASLIVHRYGQLAPGDRIVLVITASAHRQAAFEASEFLVDWLKTKAPFWKKEGTPDGARWVTARRSDDAAAARWAKAPPDR
jgi:molybdopterin synthase catalytic subunit